MSAISVNRHSAFVSWNWRGVLHSGSSNFGLPATMAIAFARDVATVQAVKEFHVTRRVLRRRCRQRVDDDWRLIDLIGADERT